MGASTTVPTSAGLPPMMQHITELAMESQRRLRALALALDPRFPCPSLGGVNVST